MIDPNIWQSEDFAALSTLSKLVFIGLFSNADDEGRGRAKPVYIKSMLFPYDDQMRVTDIEKSISEISARMSITFYESDGNEYYSLDNWSVWQRVDKPQTSKIPILESVENHSGIILEKSRLKEEKGKEVEEKGKEKKYVRELFDKFYKAYPKKQAKEAAQKSFEKINPSEDLFAAIIKAVELQKTSEQWLKEGGKYIPLPSTWLNQKRWEDEVIPYASSKKNIRLDNDHNYAPEEIEENLFGRDIVEEMCK